MATKPTDPTTAIIDSHRPADGMCDITNGITIPWPSVNRSSEATNGRESSAATTVRCPAKRFRTRRYAARHAWALEPDPNRRPVPAQCDDCGAWHLVAPEVTTTRGRV